MNELLINESKVSGNTCVVKAREMFDSQAHQVPSHLLPLFSLLAGTAFAP